MGCEASSLGGSEEETAPQTGLGGVAEGLLGSVVEVVVLEAASEDMRGDGWAELLRFG